MKASSPVNEKMVLNRKAYAPQGPVGEASNARHNQHMTESIEQALDVTHEATEAPEYNEMLDPRKHGNNITNIQKLRSRKATKLLNRTCSSLVRYVQM